jgi:hypothetical protein
VLSTVRCKFYTRFYYAVTKKLEAASQVREGDEMMKRALAVLLVLRSVFYGPPALIGKLHAADAHNTPSAATDCAAPHIN